MAQTPERDVDTPFGSGHHDADPAESTSFPSHTHPSHRSSSPSSYSRPPRPSLVTTNLNHHASNTHVGQASTGDHRDRTAVPDPQPDPDGFYRRYRDSFKTRESGSIYALNEQPDTSASPEAMASVLPPRTYHFDRKVSGPPPSAASARLNGFAGRAGQDGTGAKKESAAFPRGRQASVKAFVSQFEQRADEVISMPGSKPGSRSASANNSPGTALSGRSFRSRTPSRAPAEDRYGAGRRKSGTERVTEMPPLSIQKRASRQSSASMEHRPPIAPVNDRTSGQFSNGIPASQSMLDLNSQPARGPTVQQQPLFGEVIAGQADFGWGIPDTMRPRSGSDGSNMARLNSIFRDDTQLDMSPVSPTTWYREPTFEGFDSSRMPPRTDQPAMHHKKSRSDLSGMSHATQSPSSPSSTRTQRQTSNPTQLTRSPSHAFARRISYGSDADGTKGNGSFTEHMLREGNIGASQQDFDASASDVTPRVRSSLRSPRHTLSLKTDANPRLGAQINPVSPSAKSPPLRNSRDRPSLATASSISNRGHTIERSKTVGAGSSPTRKQGRKTLPELGAVDFAARRERIQRAFSKSVEEKEAEQRRSLILEAQRRKHESEDVPPVPPVPQIEARHLGAQKEASAAESSHQRPSAAMVSTIQELSRESSYDAQFVFAPPPPLDRHGSAGDSPTLGSLTRFPPVGQTSPTPSDAGSSDSNLNYFDTRTRTTELSIPEPSGVSAELSPRPQPESIHIVLGEGQVPKSQTRPSRSGSEVPSESRWSMSSWASSTDSTYRYSTNDANDGRLASIDELHDGQDHTAVRNDPAYQQQLDSRIPNIQESAPQEAAGTEAKVDSPTLRDTPRVSQWMVDQSIVPPRSFAQDTGPANASGRTTPGSLGQTRIPGGVGGAVPTGLRKVDVTHEERQLQTPAARTDHLSPNSLADPGMSKYSQRASLVNPADFAAASPSIGDWIAVQAQDTPTDERSPHSFSERIETPQAKRVTGLRPRTPKRVDGPVLPEIRPLSSGLGIDISVDTPPDSLRTKVHHNTPDISNLANQSAVQTADLPAATGVAHRLLDSPRRTSAIAQAGVQSSADLSISGSADAPISRPRSARSHSTFNSAETRTLASEQSGVPATKQLTDEETKARDAESKRLNRRKNIIKELIDTESSFGQDMTLVVDIYKETSHVILQNPDDVRVLFSNATEIVAFSMNFLDTLKAAASAVYKLPRSKRWRTKRDSSATAESSLADESSSIINMDLTDDERDRMTSIGAAFEQNLTQMEKIYTDYLKNQEASNARLAELMKSDKVQIWLNECRAYAHDLTTAWSLDSLLVKPVQRILKYPLLLKELIDVTPENHPDFVALDSMNREIVGVSKRINAAKKRADLVEQAQGVVKKDKRKKDDRSAIAKAFGRNKEKLKQQVGLSDVVQDKAYNVLADKFGSHFFQVQVVMRDVEMYTVDVQTSVRKFENFVSAMEEHMDVAQSPYPEIESKWRMFRQAARELQLTALTDHVGNVREHVIQPMKTLLKYYEGPQRMMEKRKKRVLDHARWKQMQDIGGKIDKKLIEQGEQFVAINETLKEELPKLFTKTKQLVEQCLNIFVQLQLQWQTIWRRKLSQAIDARHLPRSAQDIVDNFSGDFKYIEAQVLSLAICNGSLKDDDILNLTLSGTTSSAATLNGDDSASRQTSITFNENREVRPSGQSRNRAASSNSQTATSYPTAAYYPAAYAQGPSSRDRAGSSASGGRRSEQSQWNGSQGQAHLGVASPPLQSSSSPHRPSSQSTRGNSAPYGSNPYDPSSYSRYSDDSSRNSHWYSNLYSRGSVGRPNDAQYGIGAALAGAGGAAGAAVNPRGSAVFSSALPPSDTTPPSSSAAPLHAHSSARGEASAELERSAQPHQAHAQTQSQPQPFFNVLFLAASVYEFNIDRARREAGYPYLTYAAGEIFDVIGEKGELWLAKNQDDPTNTLGWIWNKHFAKLANEH